jgi:hypothetical protein
MFIDEPSFLVAHVSSIRLCMFVFWLLVHSPNCMILPTGSSWRELPQDVQHQSGRHDLRQLQRRRRRVSFRERTRAAMRTSKPERRKRCIMSTLRCSSYPGLEHQASPARVENNRRMLLWLPPIPDFRLEPKVCRKSWLESQIDA